MWAWKAGRPQSGHGKTFICAMYQAIKVTAQYTRRTTLSSQFGKFCVRCIARSTGPTAHRMFLRHLFNEMVCFTCHVPRVVWLPCCRLGCLIYAKGFVEINWTILYSGEVLRLSLQNCPERGWFRVQFVLWYGATFVPANQVLVHQAVRCLWTHKWPNPASYLRF